MIALWSETIAPSWLLRGRLRKYSSDSASDVHSTRSQHAHLAFEDVPEEGERRVRLRLELPALAAGAVRVEDEPAFVESLEQDDARVGMAVFVDGAERHRVRLQDAAACASLEPEAELLERIGMGVLVGERTRRVFAPESCQPLGHPSIVTQLAERRSSFCTRQFDVSAT